MAGKPTLLWFRADLRLHDNPAVRAAATRGEPVIPLFIWCPEEEGGWAPGAASRWWLHHSLENLDAQLRKRGLRLILRRGPALTELGKLIAETGAETVLWNRRYEAPAAQRDERTRRALEEDGVRAAVSSASVLFEPWDSRKADDSPYQVFTAFWRACGELPPPPKPVATPARLPRAERWPASEPLERLGLLPPVDWAAGIRAAWTPGEPGALRSWRQFLQGPADAYERGRDVPAETGTSRMSPHLHFGEISPRKLWYDLQSRITGKEPAKGLGTYLRQLGWREFAHHLLYHFPRTTDDPLRTNFSRFPWRRDHRSLKAWQRGRTGYPIVDAGMRELWSTGWMHNRVRMIVASFLVKHLLLPWQEGARWFWDTLVDADLANNTLGWQWSAGCGADAAPYFRVFNPTRQGKKFDPEGAYVKRWVPELGRLPRPWIHEPWRAPAAVLAEAGVTLGTTYPAPIVDHQEARTRALSAFNSLRRR